MAGLKGKSGPPGNMNAFRASRIVTESFNRSCYERDNGYKTHLAKRSCLLQAHYKNDDNLEDIRKRKQEAIWQSTFSFPPLGDPERKAIALAWLFHLVGDIHQPLHTAQLFTMEYPNGDRGGNEICIRMTQAAQPMDLHRFWDGILI
jgi:hypothetical protein